MAACASTRGKVRAAFSDMGGDGVTGGR
jgi:hypothetical protein